METHLDNFLRVSPCTVLSQKGHGENKGQPGSPKPTHPKTSLYLFTFSDLKTIHLGLLAMIKAHNEREKQRCQCWNQNQRWLNETWTGALETWGAVGCQPGAPPTIYLLVHSESNAYCHSWKSAKENRTVYILRHKWPHANQHASLGSSVQLCRIITQGTEKPFYSEAEFVFLRTTSYNFTICFQDK